MIPVTGVQVPSSARCTASSRVCPASSTVAVTPVIQCSSCPMRSRRESTKSGVAMVTPPAPCSGAHQERQGRHPHDEHEEPDVRDGGEDDEPQHHPEDDPADL